MAITDITNTIQKEAEATRAKILEDADKKIEALEASYAQKKKKYKGAYTTETEQIKGQNVATVTGTSEREQKEIVDSAKRTFVDEVFDRALETLASLPDEEYKNVLVHHLSALPKNIGKCEIFAAPDRIAITKKALSSAKVTGTVKEDTDIQKGGIRLVGDTFEYDFTFDKMMREQKSALEIEVAEHLFGSKE